MRDIVEFVVETLSDIGVPVVFQAMPASNDPLPEQYITFLEYGAQAELEVADEEVIRERLIQMNVWSKENYHPLVEKVRKTMESAGFQSTFDHDGPYTDGDSHFNKVLRFAFFDDY